MMNAKPASLEEPIAAIATAPGAAGISIIRLSGAGSLAIGDQFVEARFKPSARAAGTFYHVFLHHPKTGARLDDALLLVFHAPHSYTGEEALEIQCHGGLLPARRVLEAAVAAGARLARPGEFTERAFLHGRLDLTQAEAISAFISAETERQAVIARSQLDGTLGMHLAALYEQALALSSEVEHALDFEEGELPDSFSQKIKTEILTLSENLQRLLKSWRGNGHLLRKGALVVISGAPNVGKSSLMNALLGRNRAIVNARPGTTRDAIEEGYVLNGIPIRLVDTAGLRETTDEIEQDGIKRTQELMAEADLNLRLVDLPSLPPSAPLPEVPARTLLILTKLDLVSGARTDALCISAKTGAGLKPLGEAILKLLGETAEAGGAPEIVSARQAAELQAAAEYLDAARALQEWVLLANELRAAAECLGRIIGRVYTNDLLDSIFSHFCVGK